MPFTSDVIDEMLDDLDVVTTHASLHTADPGSTGANEITGGSYTRQAITWSAASGGTKTIVGTLTFQVPAGNTITHLGTWSAATGGTFGGGGELDAPQAFVVDGVYVLVLSAVTQAATAVPSDRLITAGTGLTGGGDLSADRTLTVAYGTSSTTATVGNDSRVTGAAQKASNLSDLGSASTARTNLGLGGAALLAVGTSAGTVAAGDDSRITGAAQKASNLSDLASAATSRTNLGLGNSAILNTGTTGGTVATGDRPETILGLLSPAEWVASTAYAVGQILTHLGFIYRVNTAHTSPSTFNSYSNLTMLSAPMPGSPVLSGMYSMACLAPGTGTSAVQGNNTLRVSPWYLPNACTLTRIGAEVTSAGTAASKIRLGIYADTGSLQPGALILDAGQINGDSATVQEITISQAMVPGLYWIGGALQAATPVQPTVTTNGTSVWYPPNAGPVDASTGTQGWAHSGTVSGALPSTFSLNFVSGSAIRCHVKGS